MHTEGVTIDAVQPNSVIKVTSSAKKQRVLCPVVEPFQKPPKSESSYLNRWTRRPRMRRPEATI